MTDVIKAVDKIKDGTVDYADLNNCLQNFGVYLSKPEFEKIQELTEVDGKWHIFRQNGSLLFFLRMNLIFLIRKSLLRLSQYKGE